MISIAALARRFTHAILPLAQLPRRCCLATRLTQKTTRIQVLWPTTCSNDRLYCILARRFTHAILPPAQLLRRCCSATRLTQKTTRIQVLWPTTTLNDRLYCSSGSTLYACDPSTGTVTATLLFSDPANPENNPYPSALAYDSSNDRLYCSSGSTLYACDPSTGTVTATLLFSNPANPENNPYPSTLAYDSSNDRLYCSLARRFTHAILPPAQLPRRCCSATRLTQKTTRIQVLWSTSQLRFPNPARWPCSCGCNRSRRIWFLATFRENCEASAP